TRAEVTEIQRRLGATALLVARAQRAALSLSDRIAVIQDGRIRQIDTPENIYRRPADRFVASFIGDGSVLRARLASLDGARATVTVRTTPITVASQTLPGVAPRTILDLLV